MQIARCSASVHPLHALSTHSIDFVRKWRRPRRPHTNKYKRATYVYTLVYIYGDLLWDTRVVQLLGSLHLTRTLFRPCRRSCWSPTPLYYKYNNNNCMQRDAIYFIPFHARQLSNAFLGVCVWSTADGKLSHANNTPRSWGLQCDEKSGLLSTCSSAIVCNQKYTTASSKCMANTIIDIYCGEPAVHCLRCFPFCKELEMRIWQKELFF
jgi:hypothetical protein